MAWMDAISDIVKRYSGGIGGTASAPANPHEDFCNVAKTVPSQVTADGLAQAFRSDQTPSFPEMVSSLFQGSNPEQRAGLLNKLVGSIGPAALASIPGLSQLAGSFGRDQGITPEQASQISADQVQQAATHAQNGNPSIVDQVSSFYAAHPNVVKTLGAAAITIALQHISRRT
ncbi:MAG TPA: hypothetical protein VLW65_19940 [Bryobacteraceae bacterium]|nr:hypothetical protein [Bryobacteraceae bacterium]